MRLFVGAIGGIFFLTGLSQPLAAQRTPSDAVRVRGFVQAFYTWYMSLPENKQSYDAAIRSKRSEFTTHLVQALKNMERREKVEGEIIDMDPFLNSQDPEGSHYKAGKVTKKGSSYWVDVDLLPSPADAQDRRSPDFRNPFVIAVVVKVEPSTSSPTSAIRMQRKPS